MYNVQVLRGNKWMNLVGYKPMKLEFAEALFTYYMQTFTDSDYRIAKAVELFNV